MITTIYIPLWLDLLLNDIESSYGAELDLHSTMVRFIIEKEKFYDLVCATFTFHYG